MAWHEPVYILPVAPLMMSMLSTCYNVFPFASKVNFAVQFRLIYLASCFTYTLVHRTLNCDHT